MMEIYHSFSEMPEEMRQKYEVGRELWLYYNPDNRNNKKIHIRAIVDDYQIVYRYWTISRGWVYFIENIFWLHTFDKYIFEKRPKREPEKNSGDKSND